MSKWNRMNDETSARARKLAQRRAEYTRKQQENALRYQDELDRKQRMGQWMTLGGTAVGAVAGGLAGGPMGAAMGAQIGGGVGGTLGGNPYGQNMLAGGFGTMAQQSMWKDYMKGPEEKEDIPEDIPRYGFEDFNDMDYDLELGKGPGSFDWGE